MDFEKIIEKLNNKFPQLPKPTYWEKHGKKRFYFNKEESNQDYTFFIDLTVSGKIELRQKPSTLWHSAYPKTHL